MSDEDGKTNETGKKPTIPSPFSIEAAISRVRDLGQAQVLLQSRRLHPFRYEWIDQLEARYRSNPGKPLIHLSDLPIGTAIKLSEDGLVILRSLWNVIRQTHNAQAARSLGLENIYMCAVMRYYPYITLETLLRAKRLVNFDIDQLDPCVTHVKSHKNNWPKEIQPHLPFNFRNEDGAAILGYYTESRHANFAFVNKELELHTLMKAAVERVVGHMRTVTTRYEDGAETTWSYLLPRLVTLAGINTLDRQKIANNPVPLWMFTAGQEVESSYLRALWTAEGQPASMRAVQSVFVPGLIPYRGIIARHPGYSTYNQLPTETHPIILEKPPLLLVSAALLHMSLGMDVGLRPIYGYVDKRDEPTFMWSLEFTSNIEIKKFAQLVNFDTKVKQDLLQARLQ